MAVVLVVEDEAIVRTVTIESLEDAGHQVLEAESADDAIKVLESRADIEVVFSDVRMPGTWMAYGCFMLSDGDGRRSG